MLSPNFARINRILIEIIMWGKYVPFENWKFYFSHMECHPNSKGMILNIGGGKINFSKFKPIHLNITCWPDKILKWIFNGSMNYTCKCKLPVQNWKKHVKLQILFFICAMRRRKLMPNNHILHQIIQMGFEYIWSIHSNPKYKYKKTKNSLTISYMRQSITYHKSYSLLLKC